MTHIATNVELEMAFALGTIDGVCVETMGRSCGNLEAARAFCEQWLYEQDTIEVEESEVAKLMDDCELSRMEALRTIAVDRAGLAYQESVEFAYDNMSFAPIPAYVD